MSGNKLLSEKEIALIEGIKRGEEAVEIEFIRRYKPKIFAIASKLTKDREEAKELAQSIFMIIFEKIKKYNIDAWVNIKFADKCSGRILESWDFSLPFFIIFCEIKKIV